MFPQYQRDWEDVMAESFAAIIVWAVILLALFLVTLVVRMLWELGAIYVERALRPSPVRRFLWIALGVFVVSLVVSAGLISMPSSLTAAFGLYLPFYAFGAFVIAVVGADVYASRHDPAAEQLPSDPAVTDTLSAWYFGSDDRDAA